MKGTGAAFVAAKLKERDDRHARAGASRYMVEPNVKEGKGGLRDLHTLLWIAEYLHPVDAARRTSSCWRCSIGREVKSFIRAFDFLRAVRAHLHFATGRPEERLTFDLQPEIARRMGYGDRGDAPAVERFMRRYFRDGQGGRGPDPRLLGQAGGASTSSTSPRACRASCRRRAAAQAQGAGRAGFYEEGGRLNVDGPAVFETDPVNLIRLFKIADRARSRPAPRRLHRGDRAAWT